MKLQFAQRALSEMERGNREWLARRDKNPELFEEELAGVFENIKFSRFVTNGRVATASELAAHALRLGLTARRTVSGPLKFLDKNTALASLVTHLSYARADRSGLLEQQVDASLGWQWPPVRGPASVWAGPCATVGVAFQRRESSFVGETLRGGAGLAVALTTPLSRHVHLWAESRSIVSTQRVEARTSLRFEPSGWVGVAVAPGVGW